MYCYTLESCKTIFLELKLFEQQIKDVESQIKEESNKHKANKRDKVAETLKEYLTTFFGEKYSFEPEKFCITFRNKSFTSEVESILSHGEKSILAFCHYLASTHKVVEHENDYNKLFFVIDDPVSSMDFYFVYSVAQAIKKLNKKFSENEVPVIVFSHSLEFMSILVRNNVVKQKYILSNGELRKLGNELIMPYEEHLRDINNVANQKIPPSHTTANSIRHVLETIWRFERPDLSTLGDYISNLNFDLFENNAYLFSLIQDLSHGSLRTEIPYAHEHIVEGCKCIIKFVNSRYCGQINRINT
ncbi:MAG: AAA family ATPase [Eubacteriales bacterium]